MSIQIYLTLFLVGQHAPIQSLARLIIYNVFLAA